MTTKTLTLLGLLAITSSQALAQSHDSHVSEAVAHFSAIGASLSSDSVDGISAHASGMLALMDSMDAGQASGEHHSEMEGMHSGMDMSGMDAMHASMRSALGALSASGLDIETARASYRELGSVFIPMAQGMYDEHDGDPDWVVMTCPMAKAEWIQESGDVANPFYGTKMISCGSQVSELGEAEAHQGHDMHGM